MYTGREGRDGGISTDRMRQSRSDLRSTPLNPTKKPRFRPQQRPRILLHIMLCSTMLRATADYLGLSRLESRTANCPTRQTLYLSTKSPLRLGPTSNGRNTSLALERLTTVLLVDEEWSRTEKDGAGRSRKGSGSPRGQRLQLRYALRARQEGDVRVHMPRYPLPYGSAT